MFKHILFPTDGSAAANAALPKAAMLARSLGADVRTRVLVLVKP